jgi:hypothetical protein
VRAVQTSQRQGRANIPIYDFSYGRDNRDNHDNVKLSVFEAVKSPEFWSRVAACRGAPGVEVLPRSPRAWTGGRGDNPAARRGFFFFFGYRGVSKSAYGGRGNPNLLFQKVREAPIVFI